MTGCAAKLTSTAIGLPARSSKRRTASIGSVAFGSRLVCRLRFRLTDSVATPILAGLRPLSASRIASTSRWGSFWEYATATSNFPLPRPGSSISSMTGPWCVWLPVIRTWRMPALSAISWRMIFIIASVGPRPRSIPTKRNLVVARRDDDRLGHEGVERALGRAYRAGHHSPTSECPAGGVMSLSAAPTRKSVPSAALASNTVSAAKSPQAQLKRLGVMVKILTLNIPREREFSTVIG